MKILFVYKSDFTSVPLGILTLAANLKAHGYNSDFIDLKFELNPLKVIKELKPDIIAYTVVSFTWKLFQKFNCELKKDLDFFSLFGGPHCSVMPDFIYQDGVDAICIGEGESAMLELVQKMSQNEDIKTINNLWIKTGDIVYKNELSPLVNDLNLLPFPDYSLLYKYCFYKNMGVYYIMTSRGCPHNCSYCINHFYKGLFKGKGKYVRKRSVENVIEELVFVKSHFKVKLIIFNDDIFTLDEDWLNEFCTQYIERIGLPFEAYTRVDGVNENIVRLLSKMGCIAIYFGIESGNREIRYNILKRAITDKQIIDASLLFRKYKIKTLAFNMVCLPGENIDNAFETLQINKEAKIDYPMCFIFQPFPGTELTKYSFENNYYDGNIDSFHKSLIGGKNNIKTKDAKKIQRLQMLFIIGAKLSFTIPIIKFLIKLPLSPFYKIILSLSRAYILTVIMYRPSLKPMILFYLKLPFQKIKNYFK